jgi:AraC-like DNA-binding protein
MWNLATYQSLVSVSIRSSSASFEELHVSKDESIRLLSWENSLAHPRVFHGTSSYMHSDGMGDRWHYHPELEITHFSEGEGLRFVGDSIQRFEAPDTVILGPNLPHCWTGDKSSGVAVQCRLSQVSPFAALPEFHMLTDIGKRTQLGLHLMGDLSSEIGGMLQSMRTKSALSRLAIFLQIVELVISAKPEQFSVLSNPIRVRRESGAYANTIATAIDYMTRHFQDPIQLPDVLSQVSMSRASFSRHFTLSTGQSFTSFLQQIRLEHCRRLLATTTQMVTEAAFESGFQNLSHFNRLFRQKWGITPRGFRRELSDVKEQENEDLN